MKREAFLLSLFIFGFSNGITLDELIKTAKENNPILLEKKLDINIQKQIERQKKTIRFGEIDIFGVYNRYEDPRILYPISPPINPKNLIGAENQFIAGISYSVPIFTGFQIKRSVEIAHLGKKIKEMQYRLTKNQIIYNIRTIYLKILSLQKQKEAFKAYKDSLKELYKNVKEGVKVGKKAEVDLLKVEYELKNTEAILDRINNSIKALKEGLKTLAGKDIDLSNIEEIKLTKSWKIPSSIENLLTVKQVKTLEKISEKKLKIAKGDYLPKIFLKASAQRNTGNSEYKDLWQISLNIKYDLFDFGKRKSRYIQRALEVKKAKLQEKAVKLRIKKDIENAISQIKTAEAKIKATKKQVQLAKTVEEIEKTKYETGVSDIYDYLHAKAQRYLAESGYYQALYNREIAISYLKYILEEFADE